MDATGTTPGPAGTQLLDPDGWVVTDPQVRVEEGWLAARVESLFSGVEDLADDDVAGWAQWTQAATALLSHVDTHERLGELAFRQAADDADAREARRHFQDDVAPIKRAMRARMAGLLTANDVRAASVAATFGEHYVEVLRSRVATFSPEASRLQAQGDALARGYVSAMADVRVKLEGEQRTLSWVRRASGSGDAQVRRAGHAARSAALAPLGPVCDDSIARLVTTRRALATAAGFDSYELLRYAELRRFDYTPAHVAGLREAVRTHLLPLVAHLRAGQAAALGTELVHPADEAYDPAAAPGPIVADHGAQLAATRRALVGVDGELATLFDGIVANGRHDLQARPGKAPGAYCATTPDDGRPFVFANVVGMGRDVRTITHEFGHGLQSCLSAPIQPYDLRKPSLEACEVHSMTLELLCLPGVGGYFEDPGSVESYRGMLLTSSLLNLPWNLAVDELQHELYADGGPRDTAGRAALADRLAREWLPGVDHDADAWWTAHRWITVRHLWLFPFYFVDYAIAQLVAWQLWLESLDDHGSAVQRYLDLCRRGGTMPFAQLLEAADLPSPFEEATIEHLARGLRAHVPGLADTPR